MNFLVILFLLECQHQPHSATKTSVGTYSFIGVNTEDRVWAYNSNQEVRRKPQKGESYIRGPQNLCIKSSHIGVIPEVSMWGQIPNNSAKAERN